MFLWGILNFLHKIGDFFDGFKAKSNGLSPTLYGPVQSGVYSPVQYTDAGLRVDLSSAQTISAVWNANIQISQDIASFPIKLFQYKDGEKKRIEKHPALNLLNHKPNKSVSSMVLRRSYASQYNMRGNPLIYIKQVRGGRELILCDPDRSRVKVSSRGNKFYDLSSYTNSSNKYEFTDIPGYRVMHAPNHCMSGLWGIDVIANFKDMLGLSKAHEKYNSKYYSNNASATGILKVPASLKDGDAERYRDEFTKKVQSGLVVLGAGMEFQNVSISPEQSQFLQSRKFSIEEVARMFNMPLHKIKSLDRATNNNIEHQSKEYYQDTLQPIVTLFEQEYKKLLTEDEVEDGYVLEHDMDEILRADIKTRFEAYGIASVHKFLKRNEIRAIEGRPPLDNGESDFNDFQTPSNTPKE